MNQYVTLFDIFARSRMEVLAPARNTLTLAARSIANPTLGTTILLEFPLSAYVTQKFSLDTPVGDPTQLPTTWQLAVRTTDANGNLFRYLLIAPQTGAILWPAYEGQTLYQGTTYMEIWSVANAATANVTETVLTIGTFTRPDGVVVLNNSYQNTGSNTSL